MLILPPRFFSRPASSSRMDKLSVDLLTCICSFILHYERVKPELAFTHGNIQTTSKAFNKAAQRNLCDFIQSCTSGQWQHPPDRLVNIIFVDALRLKIHGVTQTMALSLRTPPRHRGHIAI